MGSFLGQFFVSSFFCVCLFFLNPKKKKVVILINKKTYPSCKRCFCFAYLSKNLNLLSKLFQNPFFIKYVFFTLVRFFVHLDYKKRDCFVLRWKDGKDQLSVCIMMPSLARMISRYVQYIYRCIKYIFQKVPRHVQGVSNLI